MDLLSKFKPHFSWSKLNPNDFLKNGVVESEGAKLIGAYKVGMLYGSVNTVSIYEYSFAKNFFVELQNSYKELQLNLAEQDIYGIFPLHWEEFGKNRMISVVKLVAQPVMNIVDVFFEYEGKIYSFHTYIPGEEKNLKYSELYAKYPNIRHIIDEINRIM